MSGVAGYEVQVSIGGGAFQPVYEGTATSVKVFVPFKKTLVFRVRATDGVGNESAWATAASRASSRCRTAARRSTTAAASGARPASPARPVRAMRTRA